MFWVLMSLSSMPSSFILLTIVETFCLFWALASSKFLFWISTVAVILATLGAVWAVPWLVTEIVSVGFVCHGLSQKAPKAIIKTARGQINAVFPFNICAIWNYYTKSASLNLRISEGKEVNNVVKKRFFDFENIAVFCRD